MNLLPRPKASPLALASLAVVASAFVVDGFAVRSVRGGSGRRARSEESPPTTTTTMRASSGDGGVADLAPHYAAPASVEWVRKMDDSHRVERGEGLSDVLSREDPDAAAPLVGGDRGPLLRLAAAVARTKLPVGSHDFLRDPSGEAIFCYGNEAFLGGFGYGWDEFVTLPSKTCVETDEEVEERQRLLDDVKASARGDDGGSGDGDLAEQYDDLVRVRKDGRKILLRGVNLWNVYDVRLGESGDDDIENVRAQIERGEIEAIGQAVWIRNVEHMD
ncbi:hypothetical protein ACHAWF_013506 [Thalassiosira exigua]